MELFSGIRKIQRIPIEIHAAIRIVVGRLQSLSSFILQNETEFALFW